MQQEQHFDVIAQEFTNPFENLEYTDAALQDFKESLEDFVATIIGIASVPGEKIFRLGTTVKKTYPDIGDALRASGIMVAYYNH
jgi:hypothetical protein